jgi:hypothetical protein
MTTYRILLTSVSRVDRPDVISTSRWYETRYLTQVAAEAEAEALNQQDLLDCVVRVIAVMGTDATPLVVHLRHAGEEVTP